MSPAGTRPSRRIAPALVLAVVACVAAAGPWATGAPSPQRRPNVLLVITDDQPWDTLPLAGGLAAMPFLEARLDDPGDRWIRFANAFVEVPMCCPSRASILTGRSSRRTGVLDNDDGDAFDASQTLATWLDAAGYRTGFIGKYLNGYPWARGPFVPAGWDRFLAKRNLDLATTYVDYPFIDQGVPLTSGSAAGAYATSMLAGESLAFLRGVPDEQPWFLTFAPSAPHEPWTPAPADVGRFADAAIASPSLDILNAVDGAPAWVRALPPIDRAEAGELDRDRRAMLESLGAVDRAIGGLLAEIEARGELDETLVVVLSDNGFSFGEHRWVGKRCPYAACVRTPLVVRSPWGRAATVTAPVSNLDVAPTIVDLAGLRSVAPPFDGRSLRALLDGERDDRLERAGVLVGWVGDGDVPAWHGVRTDAFSYVVYDDGNVDLFDVAGALGAPDPAEVDDRAEDPAYAVVRARLAATLSQMLTEAPRPAGAER